MDSRAISVEASTQTRMGQPWTQAPVRSRSLRSSSSEEEGDPFRGREIGHVPDGDPRVLGGTAQGELQIQVPCEGLLHPQATDALPEGGPCDFGPGESHFLGEFVEVLDFVLVHADLENLHMTM